MARKPVETSQSIHALQIYLNLGPSRNLAAAADILHKQDLTNQGARRRTYASALAAVERWSSVFKWRDKALEFDQKSAEAAALAYREKYAKDLEQHRVKYKLAGSRVWDFSRELLESMAEQLVKLKKDKALVLDPSRFATDLGSIVRAMALAADLEAHSLQVEKLSSLLEGKQES